MGLTGVNTCLYTDLHYQTYFPKLAEASDQFEAAPVSKVPLTYIVTREECI